jgi:signal transduction histidine kinase
MMEESNNVVLLKRSIDECLIMGQERIDRSELNLSIHIADVLPSLVADRTRIKQIILNVLSKSSKFTLKG